MRLSKSRVAAGNERSSALVGPELLHVGPYGLQGLAERIHKAGTGPAPTFNGAIQGRT